VTERIIGVSPEYGAGTLKGAVATPNKVRFFGGCGNRGERVRRGHALHGAPFAA
jgi:hypothetical protein